MLTVDERQKPVSNLEEWKCLIFTKKSDGYDLINNRENIIEVASYLAEQSIIKTNLTSRITKDS